MGTVVVTNGTLWVWNVEKRRSDSCAGRPHRPSQLCRSSACSRIDSKKSMAAGGGHDQSTLLDTLSTVAGWSTGLSSKRRQGRYQKVWSWTTSATSKASACSGGSALTGDASTLPTSRSSPTKRTFLAATTHCSSEEVDSRENSAPTDTARYSEGSARPAPRDNIIQPKRRSVTGGLTGRDDAKRTYDRHLGEG